MEDCRQIYYSKVVEYIAHSLNIAILSKLSIYLIENTGLQFLQSVMIITPLNIMILYIYKDIFNSNYSKDCHLFEAL